MLYKLCAMLAIIWVEKQLMELENLQWERVNESQMCLCLCLCVKLHSGPQLESKVTMVIVTKLVFVTDWESWFNSDFSPILSGLIQIVFSSV